MASLLREALDAGAIGFATSRTEVHKTSAGAPIPTLRSGAAELLALADAMRESGTGVIQLISDLYQTPDDDLADAELELLAEVVRHSGPPAELHDAAGVPLTRPVAVPDGVGRPDGRRRATT